MNPRREQLHPGNGTEPIAGPAGTAFRCGHPKTPENTYRHKNYVRCVICKRAQARAYWRLRNGQTPCELERAWK